MSASATEAKKPTSSAITDLALINAANELARLTAQFKTAEEDEKASIKTRIAELRIQITSRADKLQLDLALTPKAQNERECKAAYQRLNATLAEFDPQQLQVIKRDIREAARLLKGETIFVVNDKDRLRIRLQGVPLSEVLPADFLKRTEKFGEDFHQFLDAMAFVQRNFPYAITDAKQLDSMKKTFVKDVCALPFLCCLSFTLGRYVSQLCDKAREFLTKAESKDFKVDAAKFSQTFSELLTPAKGVMTQCTEMLQAIPCHSNHAGTLAMQLQYFSELVSQSKVPSNERLTLFTEVFNNFHAEIGKFYQAKLSDKAEMELAMQDHLNEFSKVANRYSTQEAVRVFRQNTHELYALMKELDAAITDNRFFSLPLKFFEGMRARIDAVKKQCNFIPARFEGDDLPVALDKQLLSDATLFQHDAVSYKDSALTETLEDKNAAADTLLFRPKASKLVKTKEFDALFNRLADLTAVWETLMSLSPMVAVSAYTTTEYAMQTYLRNFKMHGISFSDDQAREPFYRIRALDSDHKFTESKLDANKFVGFVDRHDGQTKKVFERAISGKVFERAISGGVTGETRVVDEREFDYQAVEQPLNMMTLVSDDDCVVSCVDDHKAADKGPNTYLYVKIANALFYVDADGNRKPILHNMTHAEFKTSNGEHTFTKDQFAERMGISVKELPHQRRLKYTVMHSDGTLKVAYINPGFANDRLHPKHFQIIIGMLDHVIHHPDSNPELKLPADSERALFRITQQRGHTHHPEIFPPRQVLLFDKLIVDYRTGLWRWYLEKLEKTLIERIKGNILYRHRDFGGDSKFNDAVIFQKLTALFKRIPLPIDDMINDKVQFAKHLAVMVNHKEGDYLSHPLLMNNQSNAEISAMLVNFAHALNLLEILTSGKSYAERRRAYEDYYDRNQFVLQNSKDPWYQNVFAALNDSLEWRDAEHHVVSSHRVTEEEVPGEFARQARKIASLPIPGQAPAVHTVRKASTVPAYAGNPHTLSNSRSGSNGNGHSAAARVPEGPKADNKSAPSKSRGSVPA